MINKIKYIALTIAFSSITWGQCPTSEIEKLDNEVGKTKPLVEGVYKVFKKIEKCKALDGGIAEGFFDLSDRLLVEQWGSVLSSKKLNDKGFRTALLRGVSDGTEKHTFEKICQNAKDKCTSNQTFCAEMTKQCKDTDDWIKNHPEKTN
jgi:hypothetical protein